MKHLLILFLSSPFIFSCIQSHNPYLAQSLEGQVINISDITRLQCALTTGEAQDKKVHWTDARLFKSEEKTGKGTYKETDNTVIYKGFSSDKKEVKGYINDFPYVKVGAIEEVQSASFFSSKDGKDSIISKGELSCENIITPSQIPLLRAKPNQKYDLRFQVIGNHVRALLVAPANLIPYQSLAYSLVVGKNPKGVDLYAMPIGGYQISLGYIEQVINYDREGTNVLTFRSVPIAEHQGYEEMRSEGILSSYPKFKRKEWRKDESQIKPVSHIQFSGAFTAFKTLTESGSKKDVYPKSLFLGEWYYSETIVGKNLTAGGHVVGGQYKALDSQFKTSTKVRLVLEKEHLVAYSLDKENSEEENKAFSNNRWVFKIPVSHLDYWASQSGKDLNAGLNEVANETEDYDKKPWIKVRFENILTPVSGYYKQAVDTPRLDEVTVSEDYLSFVLKDEVIENQQRHSLLRVKDNSSYKPLYMSQELYKLFPAFFSQKRVAPAKSYLHTEEFRKAYVVNRFDISQKPIVYHFSNLTSKDEYVRNLGRETIHLWQQTFEKAGIKCQDGPCIVLDESKDVDLGDIRYNILNLISHKQVSLLDGLFGYGPSVSDFENGELISTTTNIYLQNIYMNSLQNVYKYILRVGGVHAEWFFRNNNIRNGKGFSSPGAEYLKQLAFSGNLPEIKIPKFMLNLLSPGADFVKEAKYLDQEEVPFYGFQEGVNKADVKFITSINDIITSEEDEKKLAFQYFLATGEKKGQSFECRKNV